MLTNERDVLGTDVLTSQVTVKDIDPAVVGMYGYLGRLDDLAVPDMEPVGIHVSEPDGRTINFYTDKVLSPTYAYFFRRMLLSVQGTDEHGPYLANYAWRLHSAFASETFSHNLVRPIHGGAHFPIPDQENPIVGFTTIRDRIAMSIAQRKTYIPNRIAGLNPVAPKHATLFGQLTRPLLDAQKYMGPARFITHEEPTAVEVG